MPVSNFYFNKKQSAYLGVAIHIYNPRIWEVVGKEDLELKLPWATQREASPPDQSLPFKKKKSENKMKGKMVALCHLGTGVGVSSQDSGLRPAFQSWWMQTGCWAKGRASGDKGGGGATSARCHERLLFNSRVAVTVLTRMSC